jgi:hypothetical protein
MCVKENTTANDQGAHLHTHAHILTCRFHLFFLLFQVALTHAHDGEHDAALRERGALLWIAATATPATHGYSGYNGVAAPLPLPSLAARNANAAAVASAGGFGGVGGVGGVGGGVGASFLPRSMAPPLMQMSQSQQMLPLSGMGMGIGGMTGFNDVDGLNGYNGGMYAFNRGINGNGGVNGGMSMPMQTQMMGVSGQMPGMGMGALPMAGMSMGGIHGMAGLNRGMGAMAMYGGMPPLGGVGNPLLGVAGYANGGNSMHLSPSLGGAYGLPGNGGGARGNGRASGSTTTTAR